MDELLKALHEDVKEIKSTQVELVKQGAVHNALLREHERRSLALEATIEPIKKHVSVMDSILKYGGAVLAGLTVQAVVRMLINV